MNFTKVLNTGQMIEELKYKQTAECAAGPFKFLNATKSEKGHVILVEDDIAYDFWDTRFTNCLWVMKDA